MAASQLNPQAEEIQAEAVLAKALMKASEQLELSQSDLANVLGIRCSSNIYQSPQAKSQIKAVFQTG